MTEPQFDLARALANGGKCRTRDGRDARIICADARGPFPIIALIAEGVVEDVHYFTESGHFHSNGSQARLDLFNIPVKREGWVNVYSNSQGACVGTTIHADRDAAEHWATGCRTACVRIEWEE